MVAYSGAQIPALFPQKPGVINLRSFIWSPSIEVNNQETVHQWNQSDARSIPARDICESI